MNNNSDKYFKLYANCFLVKGVCRSAIYDLQNSKTRFIPNLLYNIIKNGKGKTVEEVKKKFEHKYDNGIDLYFNQLEEKSLGFFTDEPELFLDFDTQFYFPGDISNAIIEVKRESDIDYSSLASQLDNLGCLALEIRFQNNCSYNRVVDILSNFNESKIKSIDLLIEYSKQFEFKKVDKLKVRNLRVKEILIHNANHDNIHAEDVPVVRYTTQKISNYDCGQFNKNSFTVNEKMFTEALNFNTCLNKKVAIDSNGEIKNCPSIIKGYGNIKDISLKNVIAQQDFRDLGSIKKDEIKICKDCEFRYSCTDCRAYIDDPTDKNSHPLKCGYNPFQAKWEGDNGYIAVTEMLQSEMDGIKAKYV